jgi:uncharacterized protein (DUF486 family)
MKLILVPVLMLLSSGLMAVAWLGHLRFRDSIGFGAALAVSWLLVLPEYVLNVGATRYGYGTYTGAQMASFHLAFGVVSVALVARFVLGERLTAIQWVGFALLAVATLLITFRPSASGPGPDPGEAERTVSASHGPSQ